MPLPTFLTLPPRGTKPRTEGLTHVLDKGTSPAGTESALRMAAAHIDIWKFGWGTAYLDPTLADKVALLAASGVRTCLGGTLLEIAWAQGRADECLDWAHGTGLDSVEVSRGVAPMGLADKQELIRRAAEGFVVLSEVGRKDPRAELDPDQWTREVAGDLEAGARWVIAEGRESGTVGLYRDDATVREDIVAAALRGGGLDTVIFETPRKEQQVWFIRELGPQVNLGNVSLDETLALETLRRGLRADTCDLTLQRVPV